MKVNRDFLFSCTTGVFDNWEGMNWDNSDRKGVHAMHAYGVMDAREVKGEKLVLVRYVASYLVLNPQNSDRLLGILGVKVNGKVLGAMVPSNGRQSGCNC